MAEEGESGKVATHVRALAQRTDRSVWRTMTPGASAHHWGNCPPQMHALCPCISGGERHHTSCWWRCPLDAATDMWLRPTQRCLPGSRPTTVEIRRRCLRRVQARSG
eukprot:scaffold5342_cov344-Prasinococcus_capsulatus_cf.AAC.2